MKDTAPCIGCRENFYNAGNNQIGVRECWMLKDARLVTRWRLHWWTAPTVPGAFVEVKTYNCHHEPGQFAFMEKLPVHAVDPVRLQAEREARDAKRLADLENQSGVGD